MLKRRILVILTALAVLLGVLALVLRPAPEPEYGGEKLSEWVEKYGSYAKQPPGTTVVFQSHPHVDEAIHHMGTNALPFLIRWAGYRTTPWKKRLIQRLYTFPGPSQGLAKGIDKKQGRAANALLALCALLSTTDRAMPWLCDMLSESATPPNARWQAVEALQRQGPAGLRPLLVCLTNQHSDTFIKIMALMALGGTGRDEPGSFSTVQSFLNDPDFSVRCTATNALEMFSRNRRQSDTP